MKAKILLVTTVLGCTTMAQAFGQGMTTTTVEAGRGTSSFTSNSLSGPSTSVNTTTVYSRGDGMPGTAAAGSTISKTEVYEGTGNRGKKHKLRKVVRKDQYDNQVDVALPHIAE